MSTAIVTYDPDLPIHMKDGIIKLKETVKAVSSEDNEMSYVDLSNMVVDIDRELTVGLTQLKNHGYVTEGMANGEPTPDWVPIKREQAIKEAMEFLKKDPFLNPEEGLDEPKVDKRSKDAYTEEEWEEKKQTRKEKANDKKRKLEEYDGLVEEVGVYKEKARVYKEKYMKCKAYFISNDMALPE